MLVKDELYFRNDGVYEVTTKEFDIINSRKESIELDTALEQ
jgi:hypothetical protein